jgi:hypothetical protein
VQNNVFNMNPGVKTFVWFTIDPPIKTLKYISAGNWKKKKRTHGKITVYGLKKGVVCTMYIIYIIEWLKQFRY